MQEDELLYWHAAYNNLAAKEIYRATRFLLTRLLNGRSCENENQCLFLQLFNNSSFDDSNIVELL